MVQLCITLARQHQLQHANDCVERGSDLMAHRGQEHRLGAAGLVCRLFGNLQLVQQQLPLLQILAFAANVPALGNN